MQKPYNILSLYIVLSFAACSKDNDDNPVPTKSEPKPDFTVGYYFTNQGDSKVETVWLQTKTFYPGKNASESNRLQFYDNTYPNITPTQQIAHVFTEPHMDKKLYPGCTTYMTVVLRFRNRVYTPFPAAAVPADGHRFRVFELPADTVTAAANCTRSFNWPSDTLKYPEVRFYN
ncbi:hypothetical protein [Hymenobacter radiodurans]|uniref:hypothetical protein n=1 Tax=Hymenobacter radiodurans TaxID=2496028 RepID=UPI0010589256|nr:hypothetical protein [Hymenobacter radiodurans]